MLTSSAPPTHSPVNASAATVPFPVPTISASFVPAYALHIPNPYPLSPYLFTMTTKNPPISLTFHHQTDQPLSHNNILAPPDKISKPFQLQSTTDTVYLSNNHHNNFTIPSYLTHVCCSMFTYLYPLFIPNLLFDSYAKKKRQKLD